MKFRYSYVAFVQSFPGRRKTKRVQLSFFFLRGFSRFDKIFMDVRGAYAKSRSMKSFYDNL